MIKLSFKLSLERTII